MRLHDMVEFHARVSPASVALRDGARAMGYHELDRLSDRFAAAIAHAGVPRQGRVAILAQNCLEYYAAYFGAAKGGAVLVPLNTRLAPPEWKYILDDSGASVLVAQSGFVEGIESVADELDSVECFVRLGGVSEDRAPAREAAIGDASQGAADGAYDGDSAGDRGQDAQEQQLWQSWVSWLDEAPEFHAPEPPVSPGDAVVQMYTSGTTGRPKGAVLEHRALMASIIQSASVSTEGITGCGHIVAPLAHIGSALASMINLWAGGSVYVQADFDMPEVVRILSEEGVDRTMLVPAMIQALLVFVPDAAEREYPTLRQIGYGASPIAPEVLRQAYDVFGCEFTQGYGCTESSGALTILTKADHRLALESRPELLASAGRAAFGTELKVVDENGDELAPGEIGEIVARGPQLMREYWNLPDETAEALRDGWLYTGDAGTLDEDGYVYIKDRVKDMIVSGGENVYPAEVEHVLMEHEQVADAAVIGVPDDRWGEAVKACVVLKPDAGASEDEIVAFCRERIAGFKCPKSVDFLAELPRNASMKVLKTILREPYWQDRDRRVG